MTAPLLRVNHLNKTFEDDGTVILKDISFDVNENDFLCIIGPSGCGKTTLLRCIAGFEAYAGDISLEGNRITGPGISRMMVFQNFDQLFPWKTVKENVMFPLVHNGMSKKEAAEVAGEYLEKVNLFEYRDYYPRQLSGGMKQRVAIAKALAIKPRIILMDEPFASLDAVTRRKLQGELLTVKEKENITVLFVTHSIQEAITLSTRILVLTNSGTVKMDDINPLPKPVVPSMDGYAALWDKYNKAIEFDEEYKNHVIIDSDTAMRK